MAVSVRDYGVVKCEVAREALSARLDDEREPVPTARVDEHLASCDDCRSWLSVATQQASRLRSLAQAPPTVAVATSPRRRLDFTWPRWASRGGLCAVGVVQLVVATAQGVGLSVGLSHHHGASAGGHLLNESTAWSVALGLAMVVAARWPATAAGLAAVLFAFLAVLAGYVLVDAVAGAVTAARVLSHLPVVLGALLAILVWRSTIPSPPAPEISRSEQITLPHNASRGRRRGHLWPTDDTAA